MFRRFTKKRTFAVLGGVALALVGAFAAFAFFTSSGTGNGSATVGTAGAWSISAATSVGTLYPDPSSGGTNTVHVAYAVTNEGHGQQQLGNVAYNVNTAFSTQDSATPPDPACTPSDFRLGASTNPTGNTATDNYTTDLAAGSSVTGTATIEMIDNSANQNSCQGVTVPLSFSAK
jgi:hypothetical protein